MCLQALWLLLCFELSGCAAVSFLRCLFHHQFCHNTQPHANTRNASAMDYKSGGNAMERQPSMDKVVIPVQPPYPAVWWTQFQALNRKNASILVCFFHSLFLMLFVCALALSLCAPLSLSLSLSFCVVQMRQYLTSAFLIIVPTIFVLILFMVSQLIKQFGGSETK